MLHKNERQACYRHRASIVSSLNVAIELKENFEEKKFSKRESEEQVAEWGKEIEQDLTKTDDYIRKLNRFMRRRSETCDDTQTS